VKAARATLVDASRGEDHATKPLRAALGDRARDFVGSPDAASPTQDTRATWHARCCPSGSEGRGSAADAKERQLHRAEESKVYKVLLAASLALALSTTGCVPSHTTDRETAPSRTGRACGSLVCAPDETCVASTVGYRCQ
jgi:hypothetical protein